MFGMKVKTPRPKSREELEVDNRAALEEARITYSRYLNGITPSNDFESIRAVRMILIIESSRSYQ